MNSKKVVFVSSIIVLMLGAFMFQCNFSGNFTIADENTRHDEVKYPKLASLSNNDIINSVFDARVSDYSNLGYFPQLYEPSLQATYYALYILDAIGKLNHINQSEIIDYIMSHYDPTNFIFMDTLEYRYLDSDFSRPYYPLSTVLEVNCYAVLSLEILNSLHLINTQGMISFIWDCQYLGGFIGQRYTEFLDPGFLVPSADNTYYAVKVLDLLMNDWSMETTRKNEIIQFVNGLQINGSGWMEGGFRNDEDVMVDTLIPSEIA